MQTPRKLRADTLRVIPLGGLGDVGRNMTAFEINQKLLLVDCGVLFPEDDHPGVDLILPGLDAISDRLDDVVGLVLTHGHEDHIGAVPYLLRRRRDIPVYGSELTLALLGNKLREHRLRNTDLHVVDDGEKVQLDQFGLEFVAVNHSIPDAMAVAISTAAGRVLHTGDFKMDQLPMDGRLTDLRSFARLGAEGIDLFLTDSTNAEVPGFVTSEREIAPALERTFHSSKGRIIVACFSSHVHRVQQALDAAVKYRRKVVYVGRSMVKNMGIAKELGFLTVPPNTLISLKEIDDYPPEKVVIISTGSQGEPLSALARIANREHPVIEVADDDTVVLASSLIPGNENAVYRVINGLARLGARVVHKGNALVHVSGHAAAGELLYCYNIVRPRNVMPVHGEIRHLIANGALAAQTGIAEDHIAIVEDGSVVDLAPGRNVEVVGKIDASYIFVDGASVGELSADDLTDRKILGEEGFISIVAVVNLATRSIVSGPDIHARGFIEDDRVFDDVLPQLRETLEQGLTEGVTDPHRLQQAMRRIIGRWVNRAHNRRPMIVPVVIAT